MKGGECFMNPVVFKVAKIAIQVASIGVSLAASFMSKKELDNQITEKVAEAIAKSTKNEA